MATVKTVSVKLGVDNYDDARLKIERLSVASDELAKKHPEISVKIDSAKALLEARLLRDGIKKELTKVTMDVGASGGGNGLLSRLTGIGAGEGNNGSLFTSLLGDSGGIATSPAGIATIAGAVAALLPEIGGLAAGLTAATAGVGAFGLLALPTFDKVKNALAGTKGALKGLTPDQRTIVTSIKGIETQFQGMATQLEPLVTKVAMTGVGIVKNLLPDLKPLATAAGTAINGLLTQFSKFTQSKAFKDWAASFDKLVGPSVTAIGQGIGKVIAAVGRLISRFSAKDTVHALNVFFDTVEGTIIGIVNVIGWLMTGWDKASAFIAKAWRDIEKWSAEGALFVIGVVKRMVDEVLGDLGKIIDGGAKAFGWVPGLGGLLKGAAKSFDSFRAGVDKNLSDAQGNLDQFIASINSINGKTITTYFSVVAAGGHGPGHPLGHASGGPASGLIMTGERGRELVQVPQGSYVYNHGQTEAMMSGRNGSSITIQNLNITLPHGSDRDQGRRIVESIRSFEKGSGAAWRR